MANELMLFLVSELLAKKKTITMLKTEGGEGLSRLREQDPISFQKGSIRSEKIVGIGILYLSKAFSR